MLNLFCPLGQNVQPKVCFIFSEKAIYLFDRLGDEVNATQKGSKTYEASNSSIQIP